MANVTINDGDWIEGRPQWWWKYVMPAESTFWATIVSQRAQTVAVQGPSPDPWKQAKTLGAEAVAMLYAAANVTDAKQRTQLLDEAAQKLGAAGKAVQQTANV
jgi:hypothetical protein